LPDQSGYCRVGADPAGGDGVLADPHRSRAVPISARTAEAPSFGRTSSACGVSPAKSAHRGNSSA
jgi:hypothetical protein